MDEIVKDTGNHDVDEEQCLNIFESGTGDESL